MSDQPVWLHKLMLLAICGRQAAEHGGDDESYDEQRLERALARPQRRFKSENPPPDLAALAASLAAALVAEQVFRDNNDAIAAVACEMFLELNSVSLRANDQDIVHTFLLLATGQIDEKELAEWIREHLAAPRGESIQEESASYMA